MRYPGFLQEKGRIGLIAPSFGCTTEPYMTYFEEALKKFKESGYDTVLGPNCYKEDGIGKSTTPEACGEEINDFFCNDKSDVIISCGGGELMCEDLPYVDFEKIKDAKAKWYMGFSDNTNLTFLLNTLCDTASIYGPNAPKFGQEPVHQCVTDAWNILTGKKLTVGNYDGWYIEVNENEEANEDRTDSFDEVLEAKFVEKTYDIVPYEQHVYEGSDKTEQVSFTGRLTGGCMDCLANLIGTEFDKVKDFSEKYKEDGIIWFLEACDLNVMSIRRALWQMENAGWFKYVKGFIIGRPMHFDDTFGDFDHIEAVRGILGKYKVPIVMDIDLGHLFPMMPVVSGSVAEINAKGNEISIEYKLI